MKATLISRETGRQYIVNQKRTRIGKDGCDVNLQSPVIEKSHAIIEFEEIENAFVIRDLNTPHGTYVNECRVQNSAVRLANGDVIRFGFNGPLFEIKIYSDYVYPPVQPRSHQAWDNSIGAPTYAQTSHDTTHLPFLPLPSAGQEPEYNYSSTVTSLPYPPSQAPNQGYFDARNSTVMPHPPVRARPTSAGPTPRTRPLPSAGEFHTMHSTGGWTSPRSHHEITAEEKANEMEQKLLKMGDELSRLASFEAECHRKDGVIVSLRNEIAELKASAHLKQDVSYRESGSLPTRADLLGSSHGQNMLDSLMKEKKDFEKQSAHKLALLQNQIHSKNKEIERLEDKLHDVMSEKWSKEDPHESTNTIASLRSSLARKDHHIAQLQTDLEKSTKQKSQTASLVNTLQRESAAKDNLIHKTRNENDKLRRDIREKESQISSLSTKLTKQKASKEVEKDFLKKEEDIRLLRQKLSNFDHQIKEKNAIIRNLETDIENLKRALDENRQNDISLQRELQNMRTRYVEQEKADKSSRVEFKEYQMRVEKFRKKIVSCLLSTGIMKQNRELTDDDLINMIRNLNEDSLALQERTNQFTEAEEQRNVSSKEDERCRRHIERFFENAEKRLLRNGRRCEVLDNEIRNLQDIEVNGSLLWFKEILSNIFLQEKAWEQEIEQALEDGGMEADKGKKEPAQLIRKIFEKIKKKKEKINNLKLRLKAIENEHEESLAKFKDKFLKETEDEVSKAVEKLKRDEQTKIQNLIAKFRKREEQKVAEAVEAERKIFEREFGNLTELHKQLGQTQLSIDEHKTKSSSFQDQILQLKFAMEKAQQNEIELKKEIEERDINHKAQLEAVNKEKEEMKQKCIDEMNIFREQSRQYSLTIVALEEKLLKMNKSRKKTEQENYFYKQSKVSQIMSGGSSPKRTVSRPTSPRKPLKRDVSTATDLSLMNQNRQSKAEVQRLEQVIQILRKEASDAKKDSLLQKDVIKNLKRDLAGASARLSDMAGELDDTQKQKMEELNERIRKQDDELFTQRKQLVELSNLVEQQKLELVKQNDKLKEQMYVTHAQEKKIQNKGKEIVQLLQQQEAEREEKDTEKYISDKKAFASREITAAGSRCLGEKHDHIINRQKEALTEMRLRIKDLEQFKPPLPSQHAALQQVSVMKRELTELRSELALRDEELTKDETQLQSEARLSRELLGSVNQELAVEKAAQREFREALDISEQNYIHLVRTICSLLDMEMPLSSTTIIHLPKDERDKILKDRNRVLDKIIERISTLHDRLKRRENLLGGYENDLTQLRNSEELAGRKSAEVLSLTNNVQSKQDEIDCLREALSRVREELDQQKRLNKSLAQRKVFKMDLDRQLELEPKSHKCYEDDAKKAKEEMKKRKQAEKIKRKNYEIESLKKELRSADRELSETAAKLYELETVQPRTPRRDEQDLDTEPVLEELWKHA